MLLLFHIGVALSSVVFATYLYLSPSAAKIKASCGLIGLTLVSGTFLVISTHANMLRACMSGLVYVSIVSLIVLAARRKLAAETSQKTD